MGERGRVGPRCNGVEGGAGVVKWVRVVPVCWVTIRRAAAQLKVRSPESSWMAHLHTPLRSHNAAAVLAGLTALDHMLGSRAEMPLGAEQHGLLGVIEELQLHDSNEVRRLAARLLQVYFNDEEDWEDDME